MEQAEQCLQANNPQGAQFAVAVAQNALLVGILAAIDRNTAALTQQMEPEPPDEEENPTGGFTALDQSEPGKTL